MKREFARRYLSGSGLLLLLCFPFAAAAQTAPQTGDREIIRQARDSYYSLRRFGLVEFQSTINPNWELVLADQIKSDPAGAQAGLKLLNGLHFEMTLDHNGAVHVTHRADVAPPNDQAAAGFNQIYSGMDQAAGGFFDSWSPFV